MTNVNVGDRIVVIDSKAAANLGAKVTNTDKGTVIRKRAVDGWCPEVAMDNGDVWILPKESVRRVNEQF